MNRLVEISDEVCRDQLRMDRNSFGCLCELLGTLGGISNSKHMSVQEKVATFLSVLAHHTKNRVIKHHFLRFRNWKGHVIVNVLGVYDTNMKFIYVLPRWEGSAADSRVLHDAISRTNGLKIPKGNYYLADNGYPNVKGFLTPYKGRATGVHDEDIMDDVNNMNSSKENTPSEIGSQFNGPAYEVGDDADINDNTFVCDAEGDDTPKTRKRGRKCPSFDGETSSIITTLGGFLENTDSVWVILLSALGQQFNGPAYEVGDDADINDNTFVCDAEGDDTPKTRKRGRKCPSFDGETSSIITTLGGFLENTDSRLGNITKRIGYE
ncbi:hypothetical protein ACS0TY_021105 [Phlomoides rotata]